MESDCTLLPISPPPLLVMLLTLNHRRSAARAASFVACFVVVLLLDPRPSHESNASLAAASAFRRRRAAAVSVGERTQGAWAELRQTHASSVGCMVPPTSWGAPYRVVPAAVGGSVPVPVFVDVLVASDPVCARLTTTARWRGAERSFNGSTQQSFLSEATELDSLLPPADDDGDRIVYTTHLSADAERLDQLVAVDRMWGGCMSIGLWICDDLGWARAAALHAADEGLRARATFHVALGWDRGAAAPYPNAMRNVPLHPFLDEHSGKLPQLRLQRAAPWVFVVDADALPSVGEAVLRRWVAAALRGDLGVPPSHVTDTRPLPSAAECAAWGGAPEAFVCDAPLSAPTGLPWARQPDVAVRATARSRCPAPLRAGATVFALPSFDFERASCVDLERMLRDMRHAGSRTALPSRSHEWLSGHLGTTRARVQAESFPPAYQGLIPWGAWGVSPSAGVLPLHYSFLHEPYFLLKAPLPVTTNTVGSWGLFDEGFNSTWFDKAALHLALAAAPHSGSGPRYTIAMLPHVYLVNAHCSSATAPRGDSDMALKDAAFHRLLGHVSRAHLSCRELCPCVPRNVNVSTAA